MPAVAQRAPIVGNPISRLSCSLIEENYRQLGCDNWNRDRFNRLCAKLNRTKREMAALLRLEPHLLDYQLGSEIHPQTRLLLTIMDREIDSVLSGAPQNRGVFLITELHQKSNGDS